MLNKLKEMIRGLFRIGDRWQKMQQPPNELFRLYKGVKLRALDEVVLALPIALFGPEESIGDVIKCDDEAMVNTSQDGKLFYVSIKPRMEIYLSKSCEAMIAADDKKPRRFEVFVPKELESTVKRSG